MTAPHSTTRPAMKITINGWSKERDTRGTIRHMTVNWSSLEQAYGRADGVPQLLEEVGNPDLADEAWSELRECLCHQGTVYSASFAAIPTLADIARERKAGDPWQAMTLAGRIVAGESQLHEPGYLRTHHPYAITDLERSAIAQLESDSFEGDDSDYISGMEALLAFEGIPVWSESLSYNVYDAMCPSCSEMLEIDFYATPPRVRLRDRNEGVRSLNFKTGDHSDITPATARDFQPLAARLYGMAAESNQMTVASHIARLFGFSACLKCGTKFSVSEQIERFARRGSH
jgi:hypothetical protein